MRFHFSALLLLLIPTLCAVGLEGEAKPNIALKKK